MTREEAKMRLEVWLICGECPEDKQCYDSYLHSTCEYTDYCDEVSLTDAVKVAISALSKNKGEWIPVSERLPEDYDRVLITINGCRGLIVREAKYHKTQNEFEVLHNHERWKVGEKGLLAWQPLPEPYMTEKGGE